MNWPAKNWWLLLTCQGLERTIWLLRYLLPGWLSNEAPEGVARLGRRQGHCLITSLSFICFFFIEVSFLISISFLEEKVFFFFFRKYDYDLATEQPAGMFWQTFFFFFFVVSKLWETRDSLELSTKEAIRFIRRGQKSSPCKATLEIHPCSHTDTLGLIAVRCGSPFSQPVIKSSPAQKGVDGDVGFGRCSLYRRMMKTFSPRLRPTVALPCFCFV